MPFINDDLKAIEAKLGRPLRVLHIGNIANNAYNNARIQRQRGIDAYVLSFEYYHIMATPEWEDADFEGDVGDPFYPDWHGVNLNGFKRPKWFVAGPLDLSVRYLLARVKRRRRASFLWLVLKIEDWILCRKSARADAVREWLVRHCPPGQVRSYVPAYAAFAIAVARYAKGLAARIGGKFEEKVQTRLSRLLRHITYAQPMELKGRHHLIAKYLQPAIEAVKIASIDSKSPNIIDEAFTKVRICNWLHPFLPHLLNQFDIVQCYATYTAIPFLLGRTARSEKYCYAAYEHGTIRSLPFEATDEGMLCAASYKAAARVFVTNTDNIVATEKLKIKSSDVVLLPHAFDDEKLIRFAKTTGISPPESTARITFFTPARQDWTKPNPGYAKNNDRIFHALKILKDEGARPLLKAVAWGTDVEASKSLITNLGIQDMVEWVPAMKKKELWRTYLESHAVVDQFCSPALGGVSFETMVLGRRLISHLDLHMNRRFFGEAPPIFYAGTAEDIANAMRDVIADPLDTAGRGDAAQRWMKEYHSADRITALQAMAYREMMDVKLAESLGK